MGRLFVPNAPGLQAPELLDRTDKVRGSKLSQDLARFAELKVPLPGTDVRRRTGLLGGGCRGAREPGGGRGAASRRPRLRQR